MRTAPILVLGTASLLLAVLSGCIGEDAAPPGKPVATARLPAGFSMEDAEQLESSEARIRWRWSGEAPPNSAGVSAAAVYAPTVDARIQIPTEGAYVITAHLEAASSLAELGLEFLADGESLCKSARVGSDVCFVRLTDPQFNDLTVRVESQYVEPPSVGFVVHVNVTPPPVPASPLAAATTPVAPEPHAVVGVTDSGV